MILRFITTLCIGILLNILPLNCAENTETPPIKIGSTVALTGPVKDYGIEIKKGLEIYFDKVNATGGIDGHLIELTVLDDGYIPERAAANIRQLINKDQVLAFIGNNGTPTNLVTQPIIDKNKILLLAPNTGATILRKTPPDKYIFHLRASYDDEVKSMIKGILSAGIKPDEIAFFSQNDSYGDEIYKSAIAALKASGYGNPESLPYGRYNLNPLNILTHFVTIVHEAKKPPKVFILGGINNPNIEFIKMAHKEFPKALFVVPSLGFAFINDEEKKALDEIKILVTQIIPPLNSDLPAIKEYKEDLKKYGQGVKPSYLSLEHYIAAKLLAVGIKKAIANHQLTREGLVDTFENLKDIDIGIGEKISFDKDNHQALHKVWLTIIKDGEFVPTTWAELKNEISD
jgi:branched-chain amino acid transport system substrate-binding protein